MTSSPDVSYAHAFKITIGGEKNSKTTITKLDVNGKEGDPLVEASTPDILNENEMRTFWVSWDQGHIQLGHGARIGRDRILHWVEVNPTGISGLSLTEALEVQVWDVMDFTGQ